MMRLLLQAELLLLLLLLPSANVLLVEFRASTSPREGSLTYAREKATLWVIGAWSLELEPELVT